MGEKLGDHVAPSGAASSGQPTTSSLNSSTATTLTSRVASGIVVSGSVGGDPRTGHASLIVEKGGDPSTDHFVPSGGDVKTDHFVPSGGDVKTDHFPFSAQMLGVVDEMAATCPPYRPGRLATETALVLVSPALHTDLAFSHGHDPVHLDGFPSSQLASVPVLSDGFPSLFDPVHLDEFPSSAELPEDRGGFPSSDYLDSTLDDKSTVFTPILRIAENSERLRESDFGVQIVPASRSPSELGAHQMGLSLAGTSRLKIEPIASTGILDIGEPVELSISDRVLLRRFNSSEQGKEDSQNTASFKQEDSKTVSRVDGHSPEPSLSLYDRMLLRKYSVPGMETTLSHSSTLASSPLISLPAESMKKRRRLYQKGKLNKDVTRADLRNENSQDQESSPGGFPSTVAEPPVRAGPIISHSAPSSELTHFTLLYYTLVQDGALPLGHLREFMSLETPARRAANRLQTHAASISDSMASTALSALRRESEHRQSLVKSIADQMVNAADMRPKRFRTKWQRAVYDGPTARKDAEASERDRWIQLLANLLRSTDTPMGKLIRENPSNIQLLGGGRRAGTLRSRVRPVQKFLGWLIASHGISFPVHWRHLTEYLQVRYSEPCVRGSLKLVHSSYIFLQEVAGIEDKLTDSAMYVVALKELMSQASPGKPPRQAPRFPTILLAAFEDMVLAGDKPVFLRVLSWWLLVQSWGTLRFDDHRGLLPRDFIVSATGLQARLTRSKVSGSDKHLNFRTVYHPSFGVYSA